MATQESAVHTGRTLRHGELDSPRSKHARWDQRSPYGDDTSTDPHRADPHQAHSRRTNVENTALPLEVHVIWFPHREAFASYLADDRRRALVERYGEPFTSEHVVEVETIRELAPPGGQ